MPGRKRGAMNTPGGDESYPQPQSNSSDTAKKVVFDTDPFEYFGHLSSRPNLSRQ